MTPDAKPGAGQAKDKKLIAELLHALKACQFGIAFQKCSACAGWEVERGRGETPLAHTKDCWVAAAIKKGEAAQ